MQNTLLYIITAHYLVSIGVLTIQPLSIGNQTFKNNFVQGPLAGISCAPFRSLVETHSAPAYTYTEMISCHSLLHQPDFIYRRFIKKMPEEGKVAVQISSNNPADVAESVKRLTDYGADLIDLNCGCPVKKIRSKGCGSKLLSDATKLYSLISAMKKNTHVPISIKIRLPEKDNEKYNLEIAQAIEDAGADCLVVHGRHWTEHYETACRYEDIKFFVDSTKIPIIGNGDITCVNSLKKMLKTGCHGIMISRASVGKPWLIKKLMADINNEEFISPTIQQISSMWLQHINQLAFLLNNEYQALLHARKFSKYYAHGIEKKSQFSAAVNLCKDLTDLKKLTFNFF